MPFSHFEVVVVVRRGDLDGPGAELGIHGLVGDHGDGVGAEGVDEVLPDEVGVVGVARVYGHGQVAQQSLGAGRGETDLLVGSWKQIKEIICGQILFRRKKNNNLDRNL